ncbi:MAG: TnsA-like heteromeric transposase endonuclease subunit [Fimbriimonadaceae bacterium]|nr:TnsA-like heteromeric transposase endonuclease subunit [Fimbriimonadaceae bacterium]
MRKTASSKRNRHIPVRAFTVTNADHLELESGLEHDLVRRLDRNPEVIHLVAQPLQLSWTRTDVGRRRHVPDLLSLSEDGTVTVWDARSVESQDAKFLDKAEVTRRSCEQVGWRYEVFTGLKDVERLNLLWLHGFRQTPCWLESFNESIHKAASAEGADLGRLFALDDGSGELVACVWHLIWKGQISVDLMAPLTKESPVGLTGHIHG